MIAKKNMEKTPAKRGPKTIKDKVEIALRKAEETADEAVDTESDVELDSVVAAAEESPLKAENGPTIATEEENAPVDAEAKAQIGDEEPLTAVPDSDVADEKVEEPQEKTVVSETAVSGQEAGEETVEEPMEDAEASPEKEKAEEEECQVAKPGIQINARTMGDYWNGSYDAGINY